jgi:hypothetical protein
MLFSPGAAAALNKYVAKIKKALGEGKDNNLLWF